MASTLQTRLQSELDAFRRDGVYKRLNFLDQPQAPVVRMEGRGDVVVLSSNNYLGLCDVPEVVAAGKTALDRFGAGTGSVRFICGTFTVHRALEAALARLVGTEASLSYVSCWNANEGLTATILGEQDAIISDQLNHASIIDGVRLAKVITKCQTMVYRHSDLDDLRAKLEAPPAPTLTDKSQAGEPAVHRYPSFPERSLIVFQAAMGSKYACCVIDQPA